MIIVIFIFQFLLWQLVFSFQRITLVTARTLSEKLNLDVNQCQLAITPGWMGLLGWTNKLASIGLVVLVWIEYGFIWSALLAASIYLGLYSFFTPLFQPFVEKRSLLWMNSAVQKIKTTGGGYLVAYQIEEIMNKEGKHVRGK